MPSRTAGVAACLSLIIAACYAQPAELVLRNGKIVTLEAAQPEAQALAIRGGRIVAVGANRQMDALTGFGTQTIDLHGALAIPGFIEGHGHFTGLGASKMVLNLRDARNWDDIVAMVAAAAREAKPGAWILGRGWHQAKWDHVPNPNVQGFPVHDSLSRASPHNPVLLEHASGHAAFANAEALKLAGIDANTPDPPGGAILHKANGQPTGALQETAQRLASHALDLSDAQRSPAERATRARREIELAARECVSKGVTTFEDAGSPLATVDLLKTMAEEGKLDLRMWVMLRAPNAQVAPKLAQYRIEGAADHHLTVRAIKRQIDGALGSRGAWLLEPYSDLPPGAPNAAGLNTEDPADIRRTAELAIANGFQLCVHAIGDRANREVLNLYEAVFREHADKKNLRWRIEHAQHLNPADIPRFAALGVIASMQAIHCTSDAPYVIPRLGPKRAEEGAYVWRKLLDSGAVVTNGTDTPVEDVNPVASYYASVTRKQKDGSTFFPKQRMTRLEGLRAYTISNAYAAFEEDLKGTLKPGKLGDVTVLSQDILTVPEERIPDTAVLYTIVGGKIVYRRQ
jgi:predicted amidohydrolase YtcJ